MAKLTEFPPRPEYADSSVEYEPTKDDLRNGWTKATLTAYHRKMQSEAQHEKPKLPRKQVRYNVFRR